MITLISPLTLCTIEKQLANYITSVITEENFEILRDRGREMTEKGTFNTAVRLRSKIKKISRVQVFL